MDERAFQAVNLRGVQLKVDGHRNFWTEMAAGRWETDTLDVFDACVPGSDLFIDFGGWIGPTSLYASRYCKRIIAFEPDPAAREEFARNIALNGLTSIELRPEGIASRTGRTEMWDGGGMGDSVSSMTHGRGNRFAVDTLTPAEVRAMIGPDETYFIKMDIEGGEYAAIEAMPALFGERLTGMLISFHPFFVTSRHHSPGRWPTTLPKTLSALRKLRDFHIYKVTAQGCRRSWFGEWLSKANLPLFEAKGSYLFLPPGRERGL